MSRRIVAAVALVAAVAAAVLVASRFRGADPPPEPAPGAVTDPALADHLARLLRTATDSPRDADARATLGMCYEVHGMPELAAASYAQALAFDPDETRWRWHLARTLERLGRPDEARAAAERVFEEAPDYVPARRAFAQWRLARGDLDGALAAAVHATRIAPKDAASWIVLAEVQAERGEVVDGEASARRALGLRIDDPALRRQAHWTLGRCLAPQNRATEAATEFAFRRGDETVVWPDPWRDEIAGQQVAFDLLLHTAHALAADRADEALPILLELQRRAPRNVQVLTDLGAAYRRLGRLDEAIAVLKECAEHHPRASEPCVQLALAHEARGDAGAAFAAVDSAIALRPEQAEPHEVRGMMHLRADRVDEALHDFAAAFERDPKRASVLVHSGVAELERDRPDAALVHFERAAAADPSDPDAPAGIAIVRRRRGDEPGARAMLARSRSLAPEGSLLQEIAEEELGDGPVPR